MWMIKGFLDSHLLKKPIMLLKQFHQYMILQFQTYSILYLMKISKLL